MRVSELDKGPDKVVALSWLIYMLLKKNTSLATKAVVLSALDNAQYGKQLQMNKVNKKYYAILGVSEQATYDEIKQAFKRKAFQWHPDKNSSDEARANYNDVYEAYSVLSNPLKRAQYDFQPIAMRAIQSPSLLRLTYLEELSNMLDIGTDDDSDEDEDDFVQRFSPIERTLGATSFFTGLAFQQLVSQDRTSSRGTSGGILLYPINNYSSPTHFSNMTRSPRDKSEFTLIDLSDAELEECKGITVLFIESHHLDSDDILVIVSDLPNLKYVVSENEYAFQAAERLPYSQKPQVLLPQDYKNLVLTQFLLCDPYLKTASQSPIESARTHCVAEKSFFKSSIFDRNVLTGISQFLFFKPSATVTLEEEKESVLMMSGRSF